MPDTTAPKIDTNPHDHKGKPLRLTKAYTNQEFGRPTVLTDDPYTYVAFHFINHEKELRYNDQAIKKKYGDPNKYGYRFYWEQSAAFFQAAKHMPVESSPLASYYAILNAAKAYISFRSDFIDNFITHFNNHGLSEDRANIGESLHTIGVSRRERGVFPRFSSMLDGDFDAKWPLGMSRKVDELLYNLAFLHRAYHTTYPSPPNTTIPELFIPLESGKSPSFHPFTDLKHYLIVEPDRHYESHGSVSPDLPDSFEPYQADLSLIKSKAGAVTLADGVSEEMPSLTRKLRQEFQYIKSPVRLWYLKRTNLDDSRVLNINSMAIIFAVMHRFSEIVRYKPEQLRKLLGSKENWLIHEFLTLSLDQFVDEIAAEITGQDIMCTGRK